MDRRRPSKSEFAGSNPAPIVERQLVKVNNDE